MESRQKRWSVLVEARGLYATGIGRYLREILAALFRDPRFGEVRLLGHEAELTAFVEEHAARERSVILPYGYGFYSPRAQLAWLRMRARGDTEANVAFFPHYDAPLLALPPRSVVTVQDLIHFRVPEAFPRGKRIVGAMVLDRVVRRAGTVLVTSDSTRRDLSEQVPGAAAKIEMIPLGVDAEYWAAPAGPPAAAGGGFLLCVGNRKPHKNMVAALEVLARARRVHPDLRLVVAGRPSPAWNESMARAEALGVADAVIEAGEVTDEELRALYAACAAFLLPSLYEGFGLPALEAMASGAPVVASNRSSVPEVVGDAGVLVDPTDHDAMAEAVSLILRDPVYRADLVRRGHQRAESFTWERSTRRTLDLLDRVAGTSRESPSSRAWIARERA